MIKIRLGPNRVVCAYVVSCFPYLFLPSSGQFYYNPRSKLARYIQPNHLRPQTLYFYSLLGSSIPTPDQNSLNNSQIKPPPPTNCLYHIFSLLSCTISQPGRHQLHQVYHLMHYETPFSFPQIGFFFSFMNFV